MKDKILPAIASLLVAAAGLVSLAQVLAIHIHHHRYGQIDDSLLPFTTAQNSRLLVLGVGVLLLYLSLQIYRRKQLAYTLVTIGLAVLITASLLETHNRIQLLFYAVTLALLLVIRRQFTVASDNFSLRRGASMAISIIVVVFIYAAIGFAHLGNREVGQHISPLAAASYAAREIFTFQSTGLVLKTREAHWFVASVDTAAAVAYILAITSLFRPLRFRYGATRHDRELARSILSDFGTSSEDFFKLWPPDKHYFFSQSEDSFIAYKVVGRDALILDGPSGRNETFRQLVASFNAFCQRNGWAASCINASDEFASLTRDGDFQRIFIGNEAVIDTSIFASDTYRSKHFRYIKNRAERDGLTFDYWPAPLSDERLMILKKISDNWLSRGSRREYTFALGYFDPEYIGNCDVAILAKDGDVVAYANIIPSIVGTGRSIDHMRYTEAMPTTGMHYLLMQLILRLHEAGATTFNLGLAPLSGLESRQNSNVQERLLAVLKRMGSAYYSFGGLEQFKNKFEPDWQPRYIFYQGPPTHLLRITRSLAKALSMPSNRPKRRFNIPLLNSHK